MQSARENSGRNVIRIILAVRLPINTLTHQVSILVGKGLEGIHRSLEVFVVEEGLEGTV